MTNVVKISKIEITLKDGKKIELSLEDAKDLFNSLNEIFAKPATPIVIEKYKEDAYKTWPRPWWEQPIITWNDDSSSPGYSIKHVKCGSINASCYSDTQL